jgi:hypothetical protein
MRVMGATPEAGRGVYPCWEMDGSRRYGQASGLQYSRVPGRPVMQHYLTCLNLRREQTCSVRNLAW